MSIDLVKCITFDDGGEGGVGGEENVLKLLEIGSTRVQLPTIKAVRSRVYLKAAAENKNEGIIHYFFG